MGRPKRARAPERSAGRPSSATLKAAVEEYRQTRQLPADPDLQALVRIICASREEPR